MTSVAPVKAGAHPAMATQVRIFEMADRRVPAFAGTTMDMLWCAAPARRPRRRPDFDAPDQGAGDDGGSNEAMKGLRIHIPAVA